MKKKELRKVYLQKRKDFSHEAVDALSKKIHDQLFSRLMMHRYGVVHSFLPIVKNNEVNTQLIIETLRRDFPAEIYIPVANADGSMNHHLLGQETRLKENQWGIPEPEGETSRNEIFFEKIAEEDTMVLIPLLVFDKQGQRVGYGKGFYDRFLIHCPDTVLKVGLSFFEPVDKIEDAGLHDVRLDYCVTPDKVWSFLK